jgi:Ca2+-transporting ATPase
VDAASVEKQLDVQADRGLTATEAAGRLRTNGPNRLAEAKKESGFAAFARQYQDVMQIILLGAAVVNALVTDDVGTTVLLAGLTVLTP